MFEGKDTKIFSNNNAYLCSVKMYVLTTPLSAGSKTLSPLLHLKVTFGWLLFFHAFFS